MDAENTAVPWSLRIYLSWSYESDDEDWGISVQTSLNPVFDQYDGEAGWAEDPPYDAVDLLRIGHLYAYDAAGEVMSCQYSDQVRGADGEMHNQYVCNPDSSSFNILLEQEYGSRDVVCEDSGEHTLTCTVDVEGAEFEFTASGGGHDPDSSVIFHARVDSGLGVSSEYPFIEKLFQIENLDDFIAALDDSYSSDKVDFLALLNGLLYKTYDGDGLVSLNGGGEVNEIGPEEMYNRVRLYLLDPDNSLPTSVCRGIANFTTYLASRWGFEAHSIGIHASGMGHMITMLRRKDSSHSYQFVDHGKVVTTMAHTLTEAVEAFCGDQGCPAPIFIRSYGPDGNYERVIMTNEGQMLFESIAPADWLNQFLSF